MKIYIGADHRGFQLKSQIKDMLARLNYDVIDVGSFDEEPCDYPKLSFKVAEAVAANKKAKGILVCMTGIGHTIAANKVHGINAALCYHKQAAILSREHNDANILVLGAKFMPPHEMPDLIQAWLMTEFTGGRHARRVRQIRQIEKKVCDKKIIGHRTHDT